MLTKKHIYQCWDDSTGSGKIWRITIAGFSHPDHHLAINKDSGVAILSLILMNDVQAQHYFKNENYD